MISRSIIQFFCKTLFLQSAIYKKAKNITKFKANFESGKEGGYEMTSKRDFSLG
jgi:hypothetical protein